jgi:hypothetical protein
MRKQNFNLTLSLLLTLGGCSQIIGLSDYDIDNKLGAAGEASTDGGDGSGGKTTTGGKNGNAGTNNTPGGDTSMPQGGDQNMPQGGDQNMPQGGQAPQGGSDGAGGAAPLGALIPCDSAECCTLKGGKAVGLEIFKDGGFEGGPVGDGNTAWTQESTNDEEIITLTDPDNTALFFDSHSGDYYAYLSGIAGETSSVYTPNFVVPKDAGWMTLSGYRYFQVDTADNMNKDFCGIALYDPAVTDPAELPFFWGIPGTHPDGWADERSWKKFEASWDAVPHQGQKRYMGFRGSSDSYSTDADLDSSSFLFDDVSLKVYRCYE